MASNLIGKTKKPGKNEPKRFQKQEATKIETKVEIDRKTI